MKIFRTKSEMADMKDSQDIQQKIQHLEEIVGEIQHLLSRQGTLLKNTEKKLQEFQDTIYAMLIEDRYPPKRSYRRQRHDEDSVEL
jgi:hypothetical protein